MNPGNEQNKSPVARIKILLVFFIGIKIAVKQFLFCVPGGSRLPALTAKNPDKKINVLNHCLIMVKILTVFNNYSFLLNLSAEEDFFAALMGHLLVQIFSFNVERTGVFPGCITH